MGRESGKGPQKRKVLASPLLSPSSSPFMPNRTYISASKAVAKALHMRRQGVKKIIGAKLQLEEDLLEMIKRNVHTCAQCNIVFSPPSSS